MRFAVKTRVCLKWKISSRLTWSGGRTYRRTPNGRFSQNQNFLDAYFTKFSYPWCSAVIITGEATYNTSLIIAEPSRARSADSGAPGVIQYDKLSIRSFVCMSVQAFLVGVSRNEFPPLPREFCPLLFQESLNWPDVCWILGADHFNFEGVMGDFRKNVLQTDFETKKHANIFLGK